MTNFDLWALIVERTTSRHEQIESTCSISTSITERIGEDQKGGRCVFFILHPSWAKDNSPAATDTAPRAGKQGADVVLENVVTGTFGESLRSTAQNAIVVVLGNIGTRPVELDPGLIIMRRIRIAGSGNATFKDVHMALHLLASKAVRPFIGRVLPFPRAAEGHALMEQRAVTGRVVLQGW